MFKLQQGYSKKLSKHYLFWDQIQVYNVDLVHLTQTTVWYNIKKRVCYITIDPASLPQKNFLVGYHKII